MCRQNKNITPGVNMSSEKVTLLKCDNKAQNQGKTQL